MGWLSPPRIRRLSGVALFLRLFVFFCERNEILTAEFMGVFGRQLTKRRSWTSSIRLKNRSYFIEFFVSLKAGTRLLQIGETPRLFALFVFRLSCARTKYAGAARYFLPFHCVPKLGWLFSRRLSFETNRRNVVASVSRRDTAHATFRGFFLFAVSTTAAPPGAYERFLLTS